MLKGTSQIAKLGANKAADMLANGTNKTSEDFSKARVGPSTATLFLEAHKTNFAANAAKQHPMPENFLSNFNTKPTPTDAKSTENTKKTNPISHINATISQFFPEIQFTQSTPPNFLDPIQLENMTSNKLDGNGWEYIGDNGMQRYHPNEGYHHIIQKKNEKDQFL